MAGKPPDKTTKTTPGQTDPDVGQLGVDDRGNVTWQWRDSGDLLSDDELGAAERMSALLSSSLAISEDDELPAGPGGDGTAQRGPSFDPYERDGVARKPQRGRKKDLKQLSEWIELRKKVGAKKADE